MNGRLSKKHLSHPQNASKSIESRIRFSSKVQKPRFHGISMQGRSSVPERPFVSSSNERHNKNSINDKSQQMISSSQVFPPSSYSRFHDVKNLSRTSFIPSRQNSTDKSSFTKTNDFIQNDISIESETTEKKKFFSRRKIFLCSAISLLIILIIVLSIVLPLRFANSKTTSPSNQLIHQNLACTSGGLICSTPAFHWNYYCTPTSYNYYSCCYLSPSSTQITIEFILQEDMSYWSIDDISASQNNGELIINGGFESNLNGWILTIPSNATSATYVHNQISSAHTGSSYLHGGSQNAPAYLKQTFNVIQGQNINISFWWADGGNSVYIPGKICQATVKLT